MTKRLLVLGLALVAVLVGVLAWSLRGGAHDVELGSDEVTATNTDARAELDSGADVDASTRIERADPARAANGPRVTVVDTHGVALGGADVLWYDGQLVQPATSGSREVRESERVHAQFLRAVVARAATYTCDAEGRTRVPVVDHVAYLVARHGLLAGELELPPGQRGDVRVTVEPSDDFFVRVLSSDRVPLARVPIYVAAAEPPNARFCDPVLSDAHGIARIVALRSTLRDGAAPRLVLCVDAPLASFERTTLAATDAETQPYDLVLPPTGTVVVRVKDTDGKPRTFDEVTLADAEDAGSAAPRERAKLEDKLSRFMAEQDAAATAQGRPVDVSSLRRAGTAPSLTLPVQNGEARFAFVELGRKLDASTGMFELAPALAKSFAGPNVIGETVTVELDYSEHPFVVCRLLERGLPYAQRDVRVQLDVGQLSNGRALKTDARGDVRVWLEPGAPRSPIRRVRIAAPAYEEIVLDVARALPPGETRFDDVQLTATPPLVSGRVVDSAGAPVAGADVDCSYVVATHEGAPLTWRSLRGRSAVSAADGTFTVHGRLPETWSKLSANAERRLALHARARREAVSAARVEFSPGQSGVEVVVVRSGAITGRLRVPGELGKRLFGARVWNEAASWGDDEQSVLSHARVGEQGEISFSGLAPGHWELSIDAHVGAESLFTLGVDVVSGSTTDVGTIDLAAHLAHVRVEVVDENGTRLPAARVGALTGFVASAERTSATREPGVFEFYLRPEGGLIGVECDGFTPVTLPNVRTDQRVVLRGRVAVRVRATGGEPITADGVKLGLQFELDGEPAESMSTSGRMFQGTFDGAREFTAQAPLDGSYRASWTVQTPRGTGWQTRVASAPSACVFTVSRTDGEVVLDVAVPKGLVDQGAAWARDRDGNVPLTSRAPRLDPPRKP